MTKKTSVFQVSGSILILVGLLMVVAVPSFAVPTETIVNQTEPTDPEPIGLIDDKDESDPIRIAPDHDRRRDGTRSLFPRHQSRRHRYRARVNPGCLSYESRISLLLRTEILPTTMCT